MQISDGISLITGATGLIGSHLTREIIRRGGKVIATGRSEEKMRKTFSDIIDDKNFSYRIGIVSQKLFDKIDTPNFIFHAAGPISGACIKEKPYDVIEANVYGLNECLKYQQQLLNNHTVFESRLVVFSSATVYGDISNAIVSENDTDHAMNLGSEINAYSESKRMVETMAKSCVKQYGIDAVIVRPAFVYGFKKGESETAVSSFAREAFNGSDIRIRNHSLVIRDNIFVEDVVDGIIVIAEKGTKGEAYNISSNGYGGNYCSIDKMAKVISCVVSKKTGRPLVRVLIPDDEQYQPGIRMKNDKLVQLGWTPKNTLITGIEKMMNRYCDI